MNNDEYYDSLSGKIFQTRNNFQNSRIHFEHGRCGRVAFLGGSITHMQGWRDIVCDLLQKRFDNTEFDFINAGIPSMDSTYGAFRMQRDVFHRGRVDMLFIDAAVNDAINKRTDIEQLRGVEGIIRHALLHNQFIDIVAVYFADPERLHFYYEGITPPVITNHDYIASYYGVSTIDLAREVAIQLSDGRFTWEEFGGLHPAHLGHCIYANTIERFFDSVWPTDLTSKDQLQERVYPAKPLDEYSYFCGQLLEIDQANLGDGWNFIDCCNPECKAETREGYVNVPMLVSDVCGADMSIEFTGKAIGILVVAGPDAGQIDFKIDEQPWQNIDLFTHWSGSVYLPWVHILSPDLQYSKHRLTIKVADEKNPQSKGHAVNIKSFLVN